MKSYKIPIKKKSLNGLNRKGKVYKIYIKKEKFKGLKS